MNQFYNVTTPTHVFVIPDDMPMDEIEWIRWTYDQAGRTVLEKTLSDVEIEGQVMSVTLTQAETKLFDSYLPITVQLRVGFQGQSFPSEEFTIAKISTLNDEVIE